MYGIDGERRLTEFEFPGSRATRSRGPSVSATPPSEQFQLDVYGEVIQALYEARRLGVPEMRGVGLPATRSCALHRDAWQRPDDGIWEVRGGGRHFVHSK